MKNKYANIFYIISAAATWVLWTLNNIEFETAVMTMLILLVCMNFNNWMNHE